MHFRHFLSVINTSSAHYFILNLFLLSIFFSQVRINKKIEVRWREPAHPCLKATEQHYRILFLYEVIADDVVLITPQGMLIQDNSSYLRRFSGDKLQPDTSFLDAVSVKDRAKMRHALSETLAVQLVIRDISVR